jgi:hypothetical protein
MIGNMANLDISQEKLEEGYREKAPAIAKVQLIAGDKVMKAVAVAMGTLAELIVQLMGKRIVLFALKAESRSKKNGITLNGLGGSIVGA